MNARKCQVKRQMIPPPNITILQERAMRHRRKLKDLLNRHLHRIRDDSDETSVSSCSTLDLSESEEDVYSKSVKDDPMDDSSATSNHSNDSGDTPTNQHTESSHYDTQSDIIMDLVSRMDNSGHKTDIPAHSISQSSLQKAASSASTKPPDTMASPSSPSDSEWENPPPEFFQEWKETASKSTISSTKENPIRPPGRLSPPSLRHDKLPSNYNRFAILEEIPITKPPPDDFPPPSILLSPARSEVATNSLPNPLSTNSILEPCQRSSDTLITTPSPTPTLQSVSQNRDTSVHDFFAAKHSKKGSPRRNKRIRLPSSPSRPDILVTSSNNVPETPPNQIPVSTNETTGQYHSTIDNLDSSTTQTTGMPRDITTVPLSPPNPSLPLSEVASQVDTSQLEQSSLIHNTINTSHHSHGSDSNTTTLYLAHQDAALSDTSTVLASDNDDMRSTTSDPFMSSDHSRHFSPPSPSNSNQYNSSTADLEGNTS